MQASASLYQELTGDGGMVALSAEQLAQIETDAGFNARYGQFAELREEGEQVSTWLGAVRGAGPAPLHIFVPY